MKHYYSIGEISKLYHIGPDSLRYYEKLGILNPKRGDNQYRMYHIHDLWRLNVIRDLRELDFSMEQIKEYLENRSLSSTEVMLQQELSVIDERLNALFTLKSGIEERLDTLHEIKEQPIGIIEEKTLPLRHCHMIHSGYQVDEEMDMLIKQLVNKNPESLYIIGSNRIGSVIPYESAMDGNYRNYTDVFIIDKDGEDTLPKGTWLSVCYRGDCAQNAAFIPFLFDYALQHHLTLKGPLLELLLADIHQSKESEEHITELQIQCQKDE